MSKARDLIKLLCENQIKIKEIEYINSFGENPEDEESDLYQEIIEKTEKLNCKYYTAWWGGESDGNLCVIYFESVLTDRSTYSADIMKAAASELKDGGYFSTDDIDFFEIKDGKVVQN